MSQIHSRIARAVDHVIIHDLESANGTFVNGNRIVEPTVLRNGDVVSVAGIRQFRVHVTGDTTRQLPQNIVVSQSVSPQRDWQTRLVWSADELAQLEAERRKVMADVQQLKGGKAAPTPALPKPVRAPGPVAPPRPVVAAKTAAAPQLKKQEVAAAPPPPPPPPPPAPPAPPPVDLEDSIAKQPPGPSSVIPFVPPKGSLEYREAETMPMPRAEKPSPDFTETIGVAPKLRGIKLSGANGTVELGLGRHIVGRADDTALTIRNPQVSRNHAAIVVTETDVAIEDNKSANGTFVNTTRVQEAAAPLQSGDTVSFGSVEFTVELLS